MKYPEQAIRRALIATPAIGRLIGFKMYPMIVPTSTAMPFVTYQRNGVTREQALNSPPGVPRVDLELSIFADTYAVTRDCLLYTSPSPRDLSTSRMPSSA